MIGKTLWVIPDGYMNDTSNGKFVSHEAICVLNLSEQNASIKLTIYFEDKEPMRGFNVMCKGNRTNHIRLDMIKNENGECIPKGVAYSIFVEINIPIVCQHSRMDVSQPEMALMTTIPF